MMDFIFKFKELSSLWGAKKSQSFSLTQIAEYTGTSLPYVIKYISDALQSELEYSQLISFSEAKNIIEVFNKKYKKEIDERIYLFREKAKKLQTSYDLMMQKSTKLQMLKDWDGAFRTLGYFAGKHSEELSHELFVNLCSNIVRCGIKATKINMQEISFWLRKAVEKNLAENTEEALHDAFDLIETYSDYFQQEASGRGKAILVDILGLLEAPALELQVWPAYKSCVDNLFLTPHLHNSSSSPEKYI